MHIERSHETSIHEKSSYGMGKKSPDYYYRTLRRVDNFLCYSNILG